MLTTQNSNFKEKSVNDGLLFGLSFLLIIEISFHLLIVNINYVQCSRFAVVLTSTFDFPAIYFPRDMRRSDGFVTKFKTRSFSGTGLNP